MFRCKPQADDTYIICIWCDLTMHIWAYEAYELAVQPYVISTEQLIAVPINIFRKV